MAQHPRYPEHEIIGYGNDLEGHLSMHATMGTYITAVGLVPSKDGRLLTFDRPAFERKPLIPATLPQATLKVSELDADESFEEGLEVAVADRFHLPEDIDFRVIGNAYAFGHDNHRDRHPRLYVPILHDNVRDITEIEPAYNMHNMITVARLPQDILSLISQQDKKEGVLGMRNRAVTRFAIDVYIKHLNSK